MLPSKTQAASQNAGGRDRGDAAIIPMTIPNSAEDLSNILFGASDTTLLYSPAMVENNHVY